MPPFYELDNIAPHSQRLTNRTIHPLLTKELHLSRSYPLFLILNPKYTVFTNYVPKQKLFRLLQHLTSTVLGSEDAATLLLTALLARGHALIEGPPGIGKTSIAQALATGFGGNFKRIQFTPDLLPSDILGYNLYRQHTGEFEFISGPIFSHLLLADEINRTSPRVQSALLEAMNERQVTIDGQTRPLDDPFIVIATQNESTSTGTFPLPEPQLDRFLLSIPMKLPNKEIQQTILLHQPQRPSEQTSKTFLTAEEARLLQEETQQILVSEKLAEYIIQLCENLRRQAGGDHTVSVRGSLAIMQASQGLALLEGQPAVHPDHVQTITPHVMRHRLLCEDGSDPISVINTVIKETEVL